MDAKCSRTKISVRQASHFQYSVKDHRLCCMGRKIKVFGRGAGLVVGCSGFVFGKMRYTTRVISVQP